MKFIASLRERETTKDEKFKFLIDKDIEKLIQPSFDEKVEKKGWRKLYRKKLNKAFRNTAIVLLDDKEFTKDILNFAEAHDLFRTKYELSPLDFYDYSYSPAITAWECRLKYLSLFYWETQIKQKGGSYEDAYLPPKFEKKMVDLVDKYGLEFFWYESIAHLLLTGIWYLPRNASVIHLNIAWKYGEMKTSSLMLEMFSITSQKEIESRWNEIESLRKEVFPSLKERLKSRDIDKAFLATFKGDEELLNLIESKMRNIKEGLSSKNGQHEYRLQKANVKKTIARAKRDYSDFLKAYKRLPHRIAMQMIVLEQPLESISIF